MQLFQAITHLFPGAASERDFVLQDDGAGPYIAQWNLAAPVPSQEDLEGAWAAHLEATKWDGVRVLRAPLLTEADVAYNKAVDQGKDILPISQYRQALRDITKGPDPAAVVWPAKPW